MGTGKTTRALAAWAHESAKYTGTPSLDPDSVELFTFTLVAGNPAYCKSPSERTVRDPTPVFAAPSTAIGLGPRAIFRQSAAQTFVGVSNARLRNASLTNKLQSSPGAVSGAPRFAFDSQSVASSLVEGQAVTLTVSEPVSFNNLNVRSQLWAAKISPCKPNSNF